MRLRVAHISLQFGDSDAQHTSDITKIFERARNRRQAWLTGTESGPGAGNTGKELTRIARIYGYRPWVPEVQSQGPGRHTDCWLAVREDLIGGNWERDFKLVIPGSNQLEDELDLKGKRWGPRGLVHASFDSSNEDLGHVSVGAAHYLTEARAPRSKFWEWNEKLGREIGAWARENGKGRALVFYGGDQNMADSKNDEPQGDTFFGEPLTSLADELKLWPNTGHGPIDVIASYNNDGRVSGRKYRVLDDREFPLHTDHFYVEGEFEVKPLAR